MADLIYARNDKLEKEIEPLQAKYVQINDSADAKIVVLSVFGKKPGGEDRRVYGKCSIARAPFDQFLMADNEQVNYIIEIFEDSVEELGLTPDEKAKFLKMVLLHELYHIELDDAGKWKIRKHDIEDFRWMVEKWGYVWGATTGGVIPDPLA